MPPPSPLDVTAFLCRLFYLTSLFFHLEVHGVAPLLPFLNPLSSLWILARFSVVKWSIFLIHARQSCLLSIPCCASCGNSSLFSFLFIIAFFSLGIWHEFLRDGPEGNQRMHLTLHPELSLLLDLRLCPQNKLGSPYVLSWDQTLSPPIILPVRI